MFKDNKYAKMEECVAQFNSATGNTECDIAMRYLTYFKWDLNVNKIIFQSKIYY